MTIHILINTFLLVYLITNNSVYAFREKRAGICKTVGGGSFGQRCVFPFIYKGKQYNGCTVLNSLSLTPWCSTKVSNSGFHIKEYWGDCDLNSCGLDFDGRSVGSSGSSATTQRPLIASNSGVGPSPNGEISFGTSNSGGGSSPNSGPSFGTPNSGPFSGTFNSGTSPNSAPSFGNPSSPPVDSPSPFRPKCGVSSLNVRTRIVNGRVAAPNQWPWMVAILKSNSLKHHCGGVLISDQHILTAAHCVERYHPSDIIVRLGEHDLSLNYETSSFDVGVDKITIHEGYEFYSFQNDIAIIKSRRALLNSDTLNQICLPSPNKFFTGEEAIALGWGQKYFGGPSSDVLLQVKVNIWAQEPCVRNYAKRNRNVTMEMLCAGNDGRDSCGGDSGGPLNCLNEKGAWELCGIISWGFRCALADYPGVYIRITKYIDWISQNLY